MSILKDVISRFRFKVEDGKLKAMNRQTKAAESRLRAATRQANRFQRQLSGIGQAAVALGGVWLARLGIQGLIGDFADAADTAAKQSAAMGITVQSYQRLAYAAELSGTQIEALQGSMGILGRRARDASLGLKKPAEAFDELGISVMTADGILKDQDVLLGELAEKFSAMPDGATKTALAMELMGRSGAKMIPLLNSGRAGIEAMGDEAARLGIVMDRESLAKAEAFNDALLRLKMGARGLRNELALRIIPTLTRLSERITKWFKTGDNARKVLERLIKVAKVTGAVLAAMVARKIIAVVADYAKALWGLIRTIRTLGASALAANIKLMLIPAALLAILLLIEDLVAFTQGKDSLFGRMLDRSGIDPEPIRKKFISIGRTFDKVGARLLKSGKKIWTSFEKAGRRIGEAFGIESVEDFVVGVIHALTEIIVFMAYLAAEVADGVAFIVENFIAGAEVIGQAMAQLWLWILEGYDIAVDGLAEGIGYIVDFWLEAYESMKSIASKFLDWLVWYWTQAGSVLRAIIEGMVWWIAGVWSFYARAAQGIRDAFMWAFDLVSKANLWLYDSVVGIWRGLKMFFGDLWTRILQGFLGAIEDAINAVASILDELPDFVLDELPSSISSFISQGVDLTSDFQAAAEKSRAQDVTQAQLDDIEVMVEQMSRQAVAQNRSVSVGAFNVTVEGSADMSAPEMQAAIREGARSALSDVIEETYNETAEATAA